MRREVWPAAVGSGPEGGATGARRGLKTGRPGENGAAWCATGGDVV